MDAAVASTRGAPHGLVANAIAGRDKPARVLPLAPRNGLAPALERRRLRYYLASLVCDSIVLIGSFVLVAALYDAATVNRATLLPAYLILPTFTTIAFYNGTYSRAGLTDWRKASAKALRALLVAALLLNFFAFFTKSTADFSRVVLTAGLVLSALGLVAIRFAISRHVIANWGANAVNRLLIEAGGVPVRIPNLYRIDAEEHGLRPDISDPVALDRLSHYLRNMEEVIVSCRDEDRMAWANVLKGSGIHGEVISSYARQIGALGIVHHDDAGVSGLLVSSGHLGIRSRIMKRGFDVAVSLAALVVLSPLLVLTALLIKLEDGGPVFFIQRRMGRGNTFFAILKFRSMRVAALDVNGTLSASRDDDRITRIGRIIRKTSVDELPQLINVLKGDMSIVGPRPHALGSLAGEKMFWQVDRAYWQRHSLRPGITGLAQVRGLRGATATERDLAERLQSDLEYMAKWSLWGDVRIVIATLRVLVHDKAF